MILLVQVEPTVIKSLQDICLEYVTKYSINHSLTPTINLSPNPTDPNPVLVDIHEYKSINDLKKKLLARHLLHKDLWDAIKDTALKDIFERYCAMLLDCGRLDLSKRSRKIILYKDIFLYMELENDKHWINTIGLDHYIIPIFFSCISSDIIK